MEIDIDEHVSDYRRKRDYLVEQLKDHYSITGGEGAFYLFLQTPTGSGTEFVTRAIEKNLMLIPGEIFSPQDTHFRISYAVDDDTLEKGVRVLLELVDAN